MKQKNLSDKEGILFQCPCHFIFKSKNRKATSNHKGTKLLSP